jgi:hypothetical protein
METIPGRNPTDSHAQISSQITSCYYLSCKHSHIAVANYKLLEMLDVFSLCVAVEMSVGPTNSSPQSPLKPNPPDFTREANRPAEFISWSASCTNGVGRHMNFLFVVCFLLDNSPASEFRRRRITQKKTYNIQNTAKV